MWLSFFLMVYASDLFISTSRTSCLCVPTEGWSDFYFWGYYLSLVMDIYSFIWCIHNWVPTRGSLWLSKLYIYYHSTFGANTDLLQRLSLLTGITYISSLVSYVLPLSRINTGWCLKRFCGRWSVESVVSTWWGFAHFSRDALGYHKRTFWGCWDWLCWPYFLPCMFFRLNAHAVFSMGPY